MKTPLAAARPDSSARPQDLAVLGAALELSPEADAERQSARASAGTADDVSTPHIDERREGLNDAQGHIEHASADQATSTTLLARPVRRPLAAIAQLRPPGLLDAPGLLTGTARTHPAARTLSTTGLVAWATAQLHLTWQQDLLALGADHPRWLQPKGQPVLALFLTQPKATRPSCCAS